MLSLILSTSFYILFSIANGSLWPENWERHDAYYLILLFGGFFIVAIFNYIVISEKLDVEGLINKFINIKGCKDYKFLDVVLSHYGSLGAVGFFMILLVYNIKPFVIGDSFLFIGPVLAALFFTTLFLYSLILLKSIIYFSRLSTPVSFVIALVILMIDMQGLLYFISSVPQ